MKQLLSLLLLFPLAALAQDCNLKKEADQFSRQPKLSTGFMTMGNNSRLSIESDSKEIDFFFSLGNAVETCFDDESTVNIAYEGGRLKANFKNTGSMNCEGLFHFTFKNAVTTPSALQRLSTLKVNTITLNGPNDKTTVITLTEAQKQQLSSMVGCMIKESKSLLKQ